MENLLPHWKPCMYSKAWKKRSIGLWILSFLILSWAIAVSVFIAITEEGLVPLTTIIAILAFGIGQFMYFSFIYVVEGRKYQMDDKGITVLYSGHMRKFYPWNAFSKIVVCDFDHATKAPSNCFVVIRLATFDEPYGPHSKTQKYKLSGVETWRGYHYTVCNFSRIVFLEYSPELLGEISKLSNLQVVFSLTKYGKRIMDTPSRTAEENR